MSDPFDHPSVARLVALALEEDVARGDATSVATIPAGTVWKGSIATREPIVVAGLPLVGLVFAQLGASVRTRALAKDGQRLVAGREVLRLEGDARALLAAERTILNFLQRASGVATLTRRYVDAIAGARAVIVDTRKTIPGWRLLDKYAVRMGGGRNHRFGLDDGILIKDNHVTACGGVAPAIERARKGAPHLLRVEVECDTLAQVDQALAAGADAILLDNMDVPTLRRAVSRIRKRSPRAQIEASGGVTLERVRKIAETGVDWISVGALTHSAPAVDLTLHLTPRKSLRAKKFRVSGTSTKR